MVVFATGAHQESARVAASAIGDEQRVARVVGEVGEARTVRRPRDVDGVRGEERARRATRQGHQAEPLVCNLLNPDLGSHRRQIRQCGLARRFGDRSCQA